MTVTMKRPTLAAIVKILLLALTSIILRSSAVLLGFQLIKYGIQQLRRHSNLIPTSEALPQFLRSLFDLAGTFQVNIITISALCIGVAAWKATSRLLFHPLAKFPGPKLAAFTQLYEFYYDVVCPGQYTFLLPALHEQYGPIIRISPHELHVIDPEFYDKLYTGGGNPRDKWAWQTASAGSPTGIFGTVPHDLHRQRRAPLNNLFSKRRVGELSSFVVSQVELMSKRVEAYKGSKTPLSLKYAFHALTLDVITDYSFGKAAGALEREDWHKDIVDCFDSGAEGVWVLQFFPLMLAFMRNMPQSWMWMLGPGVAAINKQMVGYREQVKDVREGKGRTTKAGTRTVFHEILECSDLPDEDKSIENLADNAQNIVAAGVVTTANHLQLTSFFLLSNPSILQKVRVELETVMPDPAVLPPLSELEKLEYFTAVITEGHRFSHGVAHRISRVSPQAPIHYKDWVVPPGVPVGMTPPLLNWNEEIFPRPFEFHPSRYLGEKGHEQRKWVIPFSRGTRRCLGENLANAEIYLMLAAVFRRFDLELFETTREDLEVARDQMVPLPRKGSKKLRVLVK